MTSRWNIALASAVAAAVAAVAVVALSRGGGRRRRGHRAARLRARRAPRHRATASGRSRCPATAPCRSCPTSPTSRPACRPQADTAAEAMDTIGTKSQALVDTLKGLGIAAEDIQTSGLSLYPTLHQRRLDDQRLPGVDERHRHRARRQPDRRGARRPPGLRRRGADARWDLVLLRRPRGRDGRGPHRGHRERHGSAPSSTPTPPAPSWDRSLRIIEGSVPTPVFAREMAAADVDGIGAHGHRARFAGPRRRRQRRVRDGADGPSRSGTGGPELGYGLGRGRPTGDPTVAPGLRCRRATALAAARGARAERAVRRRRRPGVPGAAGAAGPGVQRRPAGCCTA